MTPITTALSRELNRIRRNGLTGPNLVRNLSQLYHQHNMRDWVDRRGLNLEELAIPQVVCSEKLG